MITVETSIDLTPRELAREVWEKDDDEQAVFFSLLGRLFYEAGSRGITQLDYIVKNMNLDDKGKGFIEKFSDGLRDN